MKSRQRVQPETNGHASLIESVRPDSIKALTDLRDRQTTLNATIKQLNEEKQKLIQDANAQIARLDQEIGNLSVELVRVQGGILALESLQEKAMV